MNDISTSNFLPDLENGDIEFLDLTQPANISDFNATSIVRSRCFSIDHLCQLLAVRDLVFDIVI